MPRYVRIDGPQDPRIEDYRFVRERDLVGRQGLFIAEGEVVLKTLVMHSPMTTRSVLMVDKRHDKRAHLLEKLPDETPVYLASQDEVDAIAGFRLNRGILAVGERGTPPEPERLIATLPEPGIILVLVGLSNHDNMGGVFRNAASFGVHGVLLDKTSCDPLYRKAIRVSVGAALTVPFARIDDAVALVGTLEVDGVACLSLAPRARLTLSEAHLPSRTALFLGAEGTGLPEAVLAATTPVAIPMAGEVDSLNVATASGIALSTLFNRLHTPHE